MLFGRKTHRFNTIRELESVESVFFFHTFSNVETNQVQKVKSEKSFNIFFSVHFHEILAIFNKNGNFSG